MGRLILIAVSGSQRWPRKWSWYVTTALDEQLRRCRPGDVLVIRHGAARRGADRYAAEWCASVRPPPGVTVREDPIPADWDHCVPACKPSHRRARADGSTWCPSAGHRRNPDVIAGARLLLAFCLNNSSGTSTTVDLARKARINTVARFAYTPAVGQAQAAAAMSSPESSEHRRSSLLTVD